MTLLHLHQIGENDINIHTYAQIYFPTLSLLKTLLSRKVLISVQVFKHC